MVLYQLVIQIRILDFDQTCSIQQESVKLKVFKQEHQQQTLQLSHPLFCFLQTIHIHKS